MIKQDTIDLLFEKTVEKMLNQPAVLFNGKSLSYIELNEKANQLAAFLRKKGIKSDKPVALCLNPSFETLIAMLGILKAGGAYLPLDPSHPKERIEVILEDSQSEILVCLSEHADKFHSYSGQIILLDKQQKRIQQEPKSNPNKKTCSHHLAYVIYTSGSTGKPKGVLIEHGSVINYSRWFIEYSQAKPKQRIDFSSNYVFDMAVTSTLTALISGLTVVICPPKVKENLRLYLSYLSKNKIHIIKITPTYFKHLLPVVKTKPSLSNLKLILLAGENLLFVDCLSWHKIYPKHRLINEYGPTETTVAVTSYELDYKSNLGPNVPIGKPGCNMECFILDAEGKPVQSGEVGELYIGGQCLARGYLNQSDFTNQQFIISPLNGLRLYKTGDLCRYLQDNSIEFLGRADFQVKIRGFRIELGEIENCLMSHQAIENVAVVPQEIKKETMIVAYYLPKDRTHFLKTSELRNQLLTRLPAYMLPAFFIKIEKFPLTENGKLDRKLLPIPELNDKDNASPAFTKLEKFLARIWAQEFKTKNLTIDDDFFELGGHSLIATRIISRINDKLGKALNVTNLYQAATIRELIPIIHQSKTVKKKKLLTNLKIPGTTLPLGNFQLLLWIAGIFESKATKLNIVSRKRLQGKLSKTALAFAFDCLIQKHEALSYCVSKFTPRQKLRKISSFKIKEQELFDLSFENQELMLEQSLNELLALGRWTSKEPLLKARLFYLKDDLIELQLCIPHLISDELSFSILENDLSDYYFQFFQNNKLSQIISDSRYRNYLILEEEKSLKTFKKSLSFWQHYLKETSFLEIASEHIVHTNEKNEFNYSTYLKIPEENLKRLQLYCAHHHLSLANALCAALALALAQCSSIPKKQKIFMNIVKSARENTEYDETLGCFLRLDLIKIDLNSKASFLDFIEQIKQSEKETLAYQKCSNLIKLAGIGSIRQKKTGLKSSLFRSFVYLYSYFISANSNLRSLLLICERFIDFKSSKKFSVSINIQNNFAFEIDSLHSKKLFGMNLQIPKMHHPELLKINYYFDTCFVRNHNDRYLVISTNLKLEFRESLGNEIIRIIGSLGNPP